MARGTGLPFPTDDATVQPAGLTQGVNAQAYSNAASWGQIAQAGRQLRETAIDSIEREKHKKNVGYLADQEVEIARQRIELHNQFSKDPAGFDRAWTAYSDGKLSETEPWAIPHLKGRLGQEGNSAYGSLLNDKRQNDEALDGKRVRALGEQATNDVIGAAMVGTLGTEQGQAKIAKLQAVLDTAVSSGFMTQEEADLQLGEVTSRAGAESAVKAIGDTYRDNRAKGLEAGDLALKEAETALLRTDDPRLAGLSEEQRYGYYHKATAEVRALEAERKQDLALAKLAKIDAEVAMTAGVRVEPDTLNGIVEQLTRAGGHAEAARLRASATRFDQLSAYGRQPIREQVRQYQTFTSLTGGAGANEDGLAFLRQEEGFTPTAKGDYRQYSVGYGTRGAAGETVTREEAERRLRAETAKVDTYLRENVKVPLTQSQRNALVSFGFNLGTDDLEKLLPDINAGNFERVAQRMLSFNQAGGVPNSALIGRRQREAELFLRDGAAGPTSAVGLVEPGNIDLKKRPLVKNADGSISTVASISANIDGKEVLLPTVTDDGKRFEGSEREILDQAVALYKKTGKHLGKFDTPEHATAYAQSLHKAQESFYANPAAAGPGVDFKLLAGQRKELGQSATQLWGKVQKQLDDGLRPQPQELTTLIQAATIAGDHDLLEDIAERMDRLDAGAVAGRAPLTAQQGAVTELQAAGATGALTAGQAAWKRDLEKITESTQKKLAEDPIALGAERFPERFGVPAPLDLSSAEGARAGLGQRLAIASFVAENYGQPEIPAFSVADRTQLAAAIARPSDTSQQKAGAQGGILGREPNQAAIALDLLAGLPDDFLFPTLETKELKTAITGATRTADPAKYLATMQAVDRIWARAPVDTARLIGDDGVKALQDWQAKLRYHSPEDLANMLRQRNDPQVAEQRKRVETEAHRVLNESSYDIGDLTDDLDPGFFVTGPDVPADARTRDVAMADYRMLFVERYAETQDRGKANEQAIERMKLNGWGRSEVNGGQLTLYPPESYYGAVKGSHDWMKEQIVEELTTRLGTMPKDYRFVADRRTQSEITSGAPPSYVVMVDNGRGQLEPLRMPDNTFARFAWDRQGPALSARENFEAQQRRIQRTGNGFIARTRRALGSDVNSVFGPAPAEKP